MIAGSSLGPTGQLLGTGPRDLMGRAMTVPFYASFTTIDDVPPSLVSHYPLTGQEQVDVWAPIRLTFDEPIQFAAGVGEPIVVTDQAGTPVVGAAAVGGTHQVDLGLGAVASGEYVVEITATGATGATTELIPLRVGA